jgi:ATP-dependent DNA helicase RecG
MKEHELLSLIATGEGQLLEFKRNGTTHLGREICAFANSLGGRILIGVDDAGKLHPVQKTNRLQSEIQSIARHLEPLLLVECEMLSGIMIITVPASRFKPHSSAGKFYLREGATCQQMNRDEIREFFYQEGLVYFDEKSNHRFDWPADFNQTAFDELVRVCGITPSLNPQQLLENLGLLKKKQMTYAGSLLLCLSASRVVPGASINCCLFQGTTTTRILDQKILDANFLGNYHAAVNYLLSHLNTAYEIGFERKERLELPEGALREALLNAMGHRDYRKPGDLQVHIFQDRVEIINPGGLVGGLTLETLGTRSIPRNPLLFGMMQRMNLVEKVGSGLKRIRDMCIAYPCASPEIEADQDWYKIVFYRPGAKAIPEVTPDVTPEVTPEVRLLKVVTGEMTRQELQSLLGLKDDEHFRKTYLLPALEAGLIEMTIPDKPRSSKQKYRLTPKGKKA